ncbi:hypothetical protein Patl1_23189 [Pistacia atlantica]|uniref:Uncharacterized protein n=1 Tax=Pistacia atlantica TaxID=434234 RepID=A0ACC0ZW18_9ROSI|nr:hypothetical protein Patl1_23189 [Pistacia atlantica]
MDANHLLAFILINGLLLSHIPYTAMANGESSLSSHDFPHKLKIVSKRSKTPSPPPPMLSTPTKFKSPPPSPLLPSPPPPPPWMPPLPP